MSKYRHIFFYTYITVTCLFSEYYFPIFICLRISKTIMNSDTTYRVFTKAASIISSLETSILCGFRENSIPDFITISRFSNRVKDYIYKVFS